MFLSRGMSSCARTLLMWFAFISVFTCASAWIGDYDVAQTLDFLSAVGEVVTAISANVPVPGLEDPAGVNGKLFARFWQGLLQCSWPENPNAARLPASLRLASFFRFHCLRLRPAPWVTTPPAPTGAAS